MDEKDGIRRLDKPATVLYSGTDHFEKDRDEAARFLRGKSYFIRTYGCQLNENDSEKIAGILDSLGMTEAADMGGSDLIVFNTCTIRENANDKIFGHLGMAKNVRKKRPGTLVMMCGCMMKEDHNRQKVMDKYRFVDIVFGPSDIYRIPALIAEKLRGDHRVFEVGDDDIIPEALPVRHARRFRALVTIMYGCNNFCTYCIVPYVRGRERSREPAVILTELAELSSQGYREVMLLGQNVNSYGRDLGGPDFADLLREAAAIAGIGRIRFMTSHPKDLSRKLIDTMADHPDVIMPHIHLPVQSGSDRILRLMNRGYSAGQYLDIVRYARERIPDLSLTTDIIVGFPGETEEDFTRTLDLMREVRFDSAFTFIYSPRVGTPAAGFRATAGESAVRDRFQRLVDLQNECSVESNRRLIGTEQIVLSEGASDRGGATFSGRTPHNRLVNFTADPALVPDEVRTARPDLEGSYFKVRIASAKTFSLDGTAVQWLS